jgi:hypothetical protein
VPADAAPFCLQQAADLRAANWQEVLQQPTFDGDGYSLALPVGSDHFYRLLW